jgi:cytochrome c biogenesis protein CcdA
MEIRSPDRREFEETPRKIKDKELKTTILRAYQRWKKGWRKEMKLSKPVKIFSTLILSTLILFSGAHPLQAQVADPPEAAGRINLYLFSDEGCEKCQRFLSGQGQLLKAMFPVLNIRVFDINQSSNYELLTRLEKKAGRRGEELPIVILGNYLLSGEKEIEEKLNSLVIEVFLKGNASMAEPETSVESSAKTFSSELIYFHKEGCQNCRRTEALLNFFKAIYPKLSIRKVSIETQEGKLLNESLSNRIGISEKNRLVAPSIFFDNRFLSATDITEEGVEALLKRHKPEKKGVVQITSEYPSQSDVRLAETSIIDRFKSLGVLAIASAGLIDGLNPCAFATIIFLLSYLSFTGRDKSEILKIGCAFTGAVFSTYLLLGLGIFSFVRELSFLPAVSKIVYSLTIAIALSFGVISLLDYIRWRRGKPEEMKLKMPDSLKRLIHRTIRKQSRVRCLFFGAILTGLLVSLLEFSCTGQVYLPTILFVLNIPSMKGDAILYLVFYNVMFILPLVAVFGLFYGGVGSERFASFLTKRGPSIKLATSILFFALGGILIGTI